MNIVQTQTGTGSVTLSVTAGHGLLVYAAFTGTTSLLQAASDTDGNTYFNFVGARNGTTAAIELYSVRSAVSTGSVTVTVSNPGNTAPDIAVVEVDQAFQPDNFAHAVTAWAECTAAVSTSFTANSANWPSAISTYGSSRDCLVVVVPNGNPPAPGVVAFSVSTLGAATITRSSTDLGGSAILVAAAPVGLSVSCNSPAAGTVGTPYTHTFGASGGTPPYTFSLVSGSFPTGLTLDTATGVLSGTPTVAGTYPFDLGLGDNASGFTSVSCSITIAAPPVGERVQIYIMR